MYHVAKICDFVYIVLSYFTRNFITKFISSFLSLCLKFLTELLPGWLDFLTSQHLRKFRVNGWPFLWNYCKTLCWHLKTVEWFEEIILVWKDSKSFKLRTCEIKHWYDQKKVGLTILKDRITKKDFRKSGMIGAHIA